MTQNQVDLSLRPKSQLSWTAIQEPNPENAAHTQNIMRASKEGRRNNWPQVRAAFDAVPLKTPIIYTAAITAAARCGALTEGVVLLTDMRNAGLAFTGPTYTSAINLYGRQGHYAEARILWDQMIAEDIPVEFASATALMNAAATAGDLAATEAMFKELPSHGLKASNPHYGCVLKACRHQAQAGRAFEVLAEMRIAGVPPSIVQYTIAVGACRQAMERGDREAAGVAREMQAAMDAEGILPNEFFLEEILSIGLGTNIRYLRCREDVGALDPEAVRAAAERLEAARPRMRLTQMLQRLDAVLSPRPAPPAPAVRPAVTPAVRWRVELRPSGDMVFRNAATGEEVAGTPAEGWAEVPSPEHNRPYFWDMATGATRWDPPTVPATPDAPAAAAPDSAAPAAASA